MWAISIEAGNSEADSEHNTLYCLFGVTMVLTEDGMRNLEHVCTSLIFLLGIYQYKINTLMQNIYNKYSLCLYIYIYKTKAIVILFTLPYISVFVETVIQYNKENKLHIITQHYYTL